MTRVVGWACVWLGRPASGSARFSRAPTPGLPPPRAARFGSAHEVRAIFWRAPSPASELPVVGWASTVESFKAHRLLGRMFTYCLVVYDFSAVKSGNVCVERPRP